MPPTHVVLHPHYPHGVDIYLNSLPGISLERPQDNEGVRSALENGGEVLVTYTWRDDFLTPSLRWIAGTGAGVEQYPLQRLDNLGVSLTTAAGVHSGTVAEHAFALLLSLTRGIGKAVRHMTEQRWIPLIGEELAGKKMVIIGLGRIGEQIAIRSQSWGMEVVGIKRRPEVYEGCLKKVFGLGELQNLCAWADILMISAPATKDGSVMIGAAELKLLGSGWLVNVGRGSLVDSDALVAALTHGKIRGAGLDVTATEPLPRDSPLWTSEKVVLTAHNGGASPAYGARWGEIFSQNLHCFRGEGHWENRLIPVE